MKTVKKLTGILLILMLIVSFCSCGNKVSLKSIREQEAFFGNVEIGTSEDDFLKKYPDAQQKATAEGVMYYRVINLDDDNFLFSSDFYCEDGKVSQIADCFRLKKIDGGYTAEEVREVFLESLENVKGYFVEKYGEAENLTDNPDKQIMEWIVENNYVGITAINYTEGQSDEYLAGIIVGLVPCSDSLQPLVAEDVFGGITPGMSEIEMLAKTGITTDAVTVEGKKMYTQTIRDDVFFFIERGYSVDENGVVDAVADRYKLKKLDKEFTEEEINENFRNSVLSVVTYIQNLYHTDFGDDIFTEYENVSVNKSVRISGDTSILIFGSTRNGSDTEDAHIGEEHFGKFNVMISKQ